ncbi:unnamed protein product, partial [Laminaria digitata]
KTSAILAIARQFYGGTVLSSMVLEINASDVRGVDTMRNQIQQQHLIDRSTNLVRFCLCCNYVNKLSSGIRSRCTAFRFSGIPKSKMRGALLHVLQMEGMETSSESLDAVIDICRGDARRAINLLQSLCLGALSPCDNGFVEPVGRVHEACGLPTSSDVGKILHSSLNDTFAVAFRSLSSLLSERGFSLAQVISVLAERVVASDKIGPERMKSILVESAHIEWSLSDGGTESLGIGAAIGAFHIDVETY